MLGFVIVRHVNSTTTDEYWKLSYSQIRKYYTNPILIVDDNSNSKFLKEDIALVNCQTVKSEFPGTGELLGYYYFHKTHFAEKAVIIHDSVFINTYIDFDGCGQARTIWSFRHDWDADKEIIKLIEKLENYQEVVNLYVKKDSWHGSFGVMNVISWDLLNKINNRYKLFNNIIPHIKSREDRTLVERVLPCLIQLMYPSYRYPQHIIKDIHEHGWGLSYEQFKRTNTSNLPIIKVWTGR
jgi:hypothetical protein